MEYQLEENNIHTKELYWRYFRKGFRGIKRATWFVTARDDDKLVGCMGVLEKEAGQFNFLHLVVHPDYQKQGLGRQLLTTIFREMEERGHETIFGLALPHTVSICKEVGLHPVFNLTPVSTSPTF